MRPKVLFGDPLSKNVNPGPGTYKHYSTVENLPTYKFGSSQRGNLASREKNPGPGTYSLRFNSEQPLFGFGTSVRESLKSRETPGPGTYQMSSTLTNICKSMSGRNADLSTKCNEKFPGPGTYNEKRNLAMNKTSPAWCIGSEAKLPDKKCVTNVPGPGNYEAKDLIGSNLASGIQSPKWSVGTSKRQPLAMLHSVPGPGNYQLKPQIEDGPKYTFGATGSRREDGLPKPVDVNGPGAYNPE